LRWQTRRRADQRRHQREAAFAAMASATDEREVATKRRAPLSRSVKTPTAPPVDETSGEPSAAVTAPVPVPDRLGAAWLLRENK
jgi:hypothetical protein